MTDKQICRQLPLKLLHEAAGARFGAFSGWNIPLTYPAGVMAEHLHTRASVSLFDISHMQIIEICGDEAALLLEKLCPMNAAHLAEGQSKYTFLLNDAAGIIDDVIITKMGALRYLIVVNAGNAGQDLVHFNQHAKSMDVKITQLPRVLLALQGPDAEDVLQKIGFDFSKLAFMTATETNEGWFITRSGYTGEDGFEIVLPLIDAVKLVTNLLQDNRVKWAGLAARDSLRLEAGLCLHGQDIDDTINPVTAGLLWAIPKDLRDNASFIGADKLRLIIENGVKNTRAGFITLGRQPVRAGVKIQDENGRTVGHITSGGYGPSVRHPIAMGYIEKSFNKISAPLFAEVRGNLVPLRVASLPFIQHRYHKG